MKRYLVMIAVAAMILAPAVVKAEGDAKEIKFGGKLTKVEKDGKVEFVVTTAESVKVVLPAAPAIKLDELVNANVDVVAKGTKAEKEIKVTEVTAVTKAVEAAKDAHAAPKAP